MPIKYYVLELSPVCGGGGVQKLKEPQSEENQGWEVMGGDGWGRRAQAQGRRAC